jgi:hypothetical protein
MRGRCGLLRECRVGRASLRALRARYVSAHGESLRPGYRAKLAHGNCVQAQVLRGVPLVFVRQAHRDGCEELAIPLLERGLPRLEAHVHVADDGSFERTRGLRQSLIVLPKDARSIR